MAIKKSTKAKKAAQTRKQNAENKAGKRQITAIFLFALGILAFALTIYPGESFWLVLHNFLLGLFSYAAFAIAPLLIYVAVMLTKNKPVHAFGGKVTLACLLVLEACGLLYLFIHTPMTTEGFAFVGELFTLSANLQQGGVFSLLFGYWMELLWGYTGAIIFDFILLLVSVLLFTGLTLADALRLAKKPVDKLGEVYHTQVEAYKERKNRFNVDVDIDGVAENQPKTKTAAAAKEDIKPELDAVMRAFGAAPAEEAKPAPVEEKSEEPVQSKTADLAALAEERAAMIAAEEEADAKTKFDPPAENEEKGAPKTAYRFPPLSLLRQKETTNTTDIRRELEENGNHLVQVLESFGVSTKVTHISRGPSVTRYELQPSAGVKISRITNLADDIALNLAASGVRIEAPIPGKAAVGIEVPNKTRSAVNLSEIVGSREFKSAKSKLTVALGRDIAGNVAITDIASMPHILIAGATGSGKSVCINTFIMSLLYKATPDEVRLLLIDPKVVELGVYNGIPHLLVPVVTDPKKASGALAWAVGEMMQRYKLFAETDTRNLKAYNELAEKDETRKPLPQIVIIIDELADLMMAAPGEVEDAICRLAQMARAAGMHLMIATQRPSVDVITGLIKANIPSRLSFAVTSQIDSRTILDGGGAEKLLGRGDMLFKPMGENKSQRIQGCFVSDAEIESVISFLTADSQAEYDEEVAKEIERLKATEKGKRGSGGGDDLPDEEEVDEIFFKAIEVVVEAGQASTSLLQRRLKLGYARAARYIDMMDQRGIVGPFEGSKPRKVLITKEQLMEMTLNNTLPVPEELP